MVWKKSSDVAGGSSARPARAGIVMAGHTPHFSSETLTLLRSRLTTASLLVTCILTAALVFDLLVRGVVLGYLHVSVLVLFGGAYAVLRSRMELGLAQLRRIELLLFAAFN